MIKLTKFRFRAESQTDPGYGEKSFSDIPIVRELRKWHRNASQRQKGAPRSSTEEQKWISWPEYLQVVQTLKYDLVDLLHNHQPDTLGHVTGRKIAVLFQRYLILAIFARVPDRQRTIRELQLGQTLVRSADGQWCIRHSPQDYKTGKTYGERPPLDLGAALTPWIDEFLSKWRKFLIKEESNDSHDYLFCQVRTGNPLTSNSVYQIVSRACFAATGKRTNPHLLRDMIVTHVRESSNASEQQLEALALFMGHSLAVQRSSYDRRTLTKKVAPAVKLLESVNAELTI